MLILIPLGVLEAGDLATAVDLAIPGARGAFVSAVGFLSQVGVCLSHLPPYRTGCSHYPNEAASG